MSTADFDNVVLEFMREYPTTVNFTRVVDSSYDPATGQVTTSSTPWTLNAILVDLQTMKDGVSTRFGTVFVAGDKEVFIQPPQKADPSAVPLTTIDPSTDKIVVNGITYNIVSWREVNPTGTDPILFDLYIRR
jgi:hypothetical protein